MYFSKYVFLKGLTIEKIFLSITFHVLIDFTPRLVFLQKPSENTKNLLHLAVCTATWVEILLSHCLVSLSHLAKHNLLSALLGREPVPTLSSILGVDLLVLSPRYSVFLAQHTETGPAQVMEDRLSAGEGHFVFLTQNLIVNIRLKGERWSEFPPSTPGGSSFLGLLQNWVWHVGTTRGSLQKEGGLPSNRCFR